MDWVAGISIGAVDWGVGLPAMLRKSASRDCEVRLKSSAEPGAPKEHHGQSLDIVCRGRSGIRSEAFDEL